MKKLSILIPTIDERRPQFKELMLFLTAQAIDHKIEEQVEIITLCDRGLLSIGAKRNELLKRATGDYVAFIDDDDQVCSYYIGWGLKVAESGKDCGSLIGIYTVDGENPEYFEHSIKYKEYKTTSNEIKYERYPNHLNFIKREIAQQFKFPEINHGEDTDWATQIFKAGAIKTEYEISQILYQYRYKTKK